MVKNFFISHVENDNILRKAINDINLLPDVEKAVYMSFQQKIKVVYNGEIDEKRLGKDVADVLHNYDDRIQISENSVALRNTLDRRNLLLFCMGLIVYGIAFIPIIPSGFKWIIYLLGLALSSKVLIRKVYVAGYQEKRIHESMLILLAIIGAFLIQDYLEAMLVLIIYQIADFLSWKASLLAKNDVSETLHKEASMVYRLTDKTVLPTPIKEIKEKDIIVVRPGEVIPLLCRVLEGRSTIDMSAISIENYKMNAAPGMELKSGAINVEKPLKLMVLRPYNEGIVKELITKTEEAMEQKQGFAKTSEKIGNTYIKVVGALALLVLISSFFANNPSQSIYKGLTLLAVSCPWAMLLSTPIAYNYALSLAKKLGILIKDIGSIDAIGKLSTVFFTKTGVLTTGDYKVQEIIPYKKNPEEYILTYAAIGEMKARHPIGLAILKAMSKELNTSLLEKYKEEKGRGAMAVYGGKTIFVGTENFLLDNNIEVINDYKGIQVHVGVDQQYIGSIVLEETLKDEGAQVVEKLKELNIHKVAVITGAEKKGSEGVLAPLHVSNIYGDLNIEEKVNRIRKEKKKLKGKTVAFVGDTLSDAMVMAASDVSMAFLKEGRLDRVTEIADVVFLKEDMNLIYEGISLGKRTYRIIKENILISLLTKGVIIFYLLITKVDTGFMLFAIGIDLLVSLLTIINCFRISRGLRFIWDFIQEKVPFLKRGKNGSKPQGKEQDPDEKRAS